MGSAALVSPLQRYAAWAFENECGAWTDAPNFAGQSASPWARSSPWTRRRNATDHTLFIWGFQVSWLRAKRQDMTLQ